MMTTISLMEILTTAIQSDRAETTLDERLGCGYARRDDRYGATCCPNLRGEAFNVWCAANGAARRSPCVFAEDETAEIWADIREQQWRERRG